MSSSKCFELHAYVPTNLPPTLLLDATGREFRSYELSLLEPYSVDRLKTFLGVRGPEIRTLINLRVRAWNARSYFLCRTLVQERAFGFINQRYFSFIEVTTGDEYVLKSEEVKTCCKASQQVVGACYRFRSFIRN